MRMHFEIIKDLKTGDIKFHGEVTEADVLGLKLDLLDKALLNCPCETSDEHLLVLEMLFRRYNQKGN
jgi:hypothetical protein